MAEKHFTMNDIERLVYALTKLSWVLDCSANEILELVKGHLLSEEEVSEIQCSLREE